MRTLAQWLVLLAAPPQVGEALLGDFDERGDGPWPMLCSVPALLQWQLRQRGLRTALAALAAWLPLVVSEALARFVLSQVPLKADAVLPPAYALTGIILSATASATVLLIRLDRKGD